MGPSLPVAGVACPWLGWPARGWGGLSVAGLCCLPHEAEWRVCFLGRQSHFLLRKTHVPSWLCHLPGRGGQGLRPHESGVSDEVEREDRGWNQKILNGTWLHSEPASVNSARAS